MRLKMEQEKKMVGLQLLRHPFEAHQINQLPKGTKAQNECPDSQKVNCSECGGWHHPKIKHLSYVGHAALTDRLLNCDPEWTWEPLAFDEHGLPAFDKEGGLWIRLTVCGVTRLGYGNAAGKAYMDAGARIKEVIGDALRNAAMRGGAALELWHKGQLHLDEEPEIEQDPIVSIQPPNDDDRRMSCALAAARLKKEVDTIKSGIENGAGDDFKLAAEAWFGLSDSDKSDLWLAPTKGGIFTVHERSVIKSKEFREAKYGPGSSEGE